MEPVDPPIDPRLVPRTVYMRNDANTWNRRLPFTIVVTDEEAFTDWYHTTVGQRPNLATQGDVRWPHIWEFDIPLERRLP